MITDGTLYQNSLIFTKKEEKILEDAYLNDMPNTDRRLEHPPEMILVKLGSTLKKDRHHILDWFRQRNINVSFEIISNIYSKTFRKIGKMGLKRIKDFWRDIFKRTIFQRKKK
jgi:hypothetical protein